MAARDRGIGTLDPATLAEGVFAASRAIIIVLDGDGVVLHCNEQAASLTGYPVSEIVGARWTDRFVPERERAHIAAVIASTVSGRPTLSTINPVLHRDGTERLVEWYDARLSDADGRMTGVLAVGVDVTETREKAVVLRDLALALDRAADIDAALATSLDSVLRIAQMDAGVVFAVEPRAIRAVAHREVTAVTGARIAQVNPQSSFGRWLLGFSQPRFLHARDLPEELRAEVLGEGVRAMAYLPVGHAGRIVAGLVIGSRKHDALPAAERPLLDAVMAQIGSTMLRLQAQQGAARLEEQLQQAIKMEAIGRLAGGVAHDFNNILTAILNYAEFALGGLGEAEPVREDVTEIRTAALRAAALTGQLLAFGRKQVIRPVVMDLNEVVRRCQRMLERLIREDVVLRVQVREAPLLVRADPSQIEQVLVNLVVNARDALPRGGCIEVSTAAETLVAADCEGRLDLSPGRWVRLSVRDDGSGMTEEVQRHLFEPFFTTKGPQGGTGLGLATVYGIVRQNHGAIRVESAPARGTTVDIHLLESQDSLQQSSEPPPSVPAVGHGTILVAEDEPMVRRLSSRILARAGYTVLAAASGAEALALAERHAGDIELLLTDVVMPGMNGRELHERLRLARPAVRVLFCSGHPDDALTEEGALPSGMKFLQKPFSSVAMLRAVGEALGR